MTRNEFLNRFTDVYTLYDFFYEEYGNDCSYEGECGRYYGGLLSAMFAVSIYRYFDGFSEDIGFGVASTYEEAKKIIGWDNVVTVDVISVMRTTAIYNEDINVWIKHFDPDLLQIN